MFTRRDFLVGAGVRFALCLGAYLVILPVPLPLADMVAFPASPALNHAKAPPLTSHRPPAANTVLDGRLVPAGTDSGIFGSVAIPFGPLPVMPRWKRVLAERSDQILTRVCPSNDRICETPLLKRLVETLESAPQSDVALLSAVNSAVNGTLAYRRDQSVRKALDHWATLSETALMDSGDCEDFAIVKMWALSAAGIPMDAMRLVVVRDVSRERYHAVLAVHARSETFILDSASSRVWRDSELQHYVPLYSVGQDRAWIHGFPSESHRVASGDLRRVHPGEPASGESS